MQIIEIGILMIEFVLTFFGIFFVCVKRKIVLSFCLLLNLLVLDA